jgi:hypothetical protein
MTFKPLLKPNAEIAVSVELLERLLDLPRTHRIAGATSNPIDADHAQVRLLVQADALPEVAGEAPLHQLEVIYERIEVGQARLREIKTTLSQDRAQ